MKNKKIVLINPPWYFEHPRDIILSQNLGIGYLCSYLQKHGHMVSVIDALAEGVGNINKVRGSYQKFYQAGLNYEGILDRIPKDSDFIGISSPFTNNARIVKGLASFIKTALPKTPIILGGVYPSLTPQDALCNSIDYYVIGEGEKALLDLVSDKPAEGIKGVVSYGENKRDFEYAEIIKDLDEIPFPARDKLPMEKYLSFISPRKLKLKSVSVITSRGCPFDCNFCSIHLITGYGWRKRSPINVLDEIKSLIKNYDIEHIEFEDDNLTLDKTRAMEIFEGIKKINKDTRNLSWSTPNAVRIDNLDEELLREIKKSNCLSLSFGIESGDPEILEKMNKKLNLEKALEVAMLCKKLDIKTIFFFMTGYPGETKDSFNKTLSFIKKLKKIGGDTFYSTITRAYPGTRLFDMCLEKKYISKDIGRENIFLGNTLTPENSIITPEFNSRVLTNRLHFIEKITVPFYLRFYHRHFHLIKKIVPDKIIRKTKLLLKI
ncbi:MAG: B12-binding domain-containing radical SAM protein [Candidatus Omnitrophica bacterium]|nr:B12-binding domain-containing radical SAM protein [Candidatus Omnitrophota bacterium]